METSVHFSLFHMANLLGLMASLFCCRIKSGFPSMASTTPVSCFSRFLLLAARLRLTQPKNRFLAISCTTLHCFTGRSPSVLGQHKPSPPPPSSDTPPAAAIAAGGSREALPDDKGDKGQEGEVNERRGAGREGPPPPGDNPVDQQLIVELEETEEDIVSRLQVNELALWFANR